ncbi:hypothetical protein NMY22_g3860 [Coprinellus aureogranulatus]|nr:hypothetical protein NMY22_g3860 [Coprinellus aureogranulatus]
MSLPILLPAKSIPKPHALSHLEWTPKRYLSEPQPPSNEDARLQEEFIAKQLLEGKIVKKTRPRRTVDYNGGMGRWALSRKLRPNPTYIPQVRPAPPYIIDLLPPKAYPDNASNVAMYQIRAYLNEQDSRNYELTWAQWTPEARRILTGSTSGEFTLWNGLTFNFETILQAHDTAICRHLPLYPLRRLPRLFRQKRHHQGLLPKKLFEAFSFSPDDQRFATASDDSSVRIWSFAESRFESVLSGHGWDVKCVEWHPTKGLIVSGSKDSQVKFWDPRTGTCLSTLHQHKNTIQALAWSPNGNLVATASRDQTVRVFDIRAMREFRVLKGHKKEVCSVAWHPFHPVIVSGGSEGAILHWDLSNVDVSSDSMAAVGGANGPVPGSAPLPVSPGPAADFSTLHNPIVSSPRATLSQAHDSNVWALTYHPLGHILVSGSNDHTTRFWSRERPGDATSVFSGGGEKPPEMMDMSGQDEEDEAFVPGFGGGGGSVGGGWGGQEDDREGGGQSRGGYENASGRDERGYGQRDNGGYGDADDYAIPGFGGGPTNGGGGGGREEEGGGGAR